MKNRRVLLIAIIILISLLSLWGCPKKAEISTTQESKPEAATAAPAAESQKAADAKAAEDAAAARAAEAAKAAEESKAGESAVASTAGLQTIHFDFDRSFIRDDARAVMKANADWLKAHPKVRVRIEGNCDERGTKEYNQALGQRRAASAKKYLTDLGISAKRISLISYGKEKPACSEANEECWQKNRRDDFMAVTE